jgi:hypothetical protein
MPKRKAPDSDDEAASRGQPLSLNSLDLSHPKTTPKAIATALLALLPPGATKHDAAAKKLVRAFALLSAELDARSNAKAKENESEGKRLPIVFQFRDTTSATGNNDDDCDNGDGNVNICDDDATTTVIQMPEECFVKIMEFLNGREIVNASTVNKVWLSVSRMPAMWPKLDAFNGLSNRGRKLNQTSLIALLGRPQFSNLKFLALPDMVKLKTTTVASIAKVCPLLETWDVGYGKNTGRGNDCHLMDAAEKFTNLASIRTTMWTVTSSGIESVAKVMGAQLLDLRVKNIFSNRSLSDASLAVIAEHCPNLKHFAYDEGCREEYRESLEIFSGVGITNLVRGCRRLEVLELRNVSQLNREDFESILNLLAQDPGSFALRKIDIVGYPFIIRSNPFSIVDE